MNNSLLISGAVLVAGGIIGGAIIFSGSGGNTASLSGSPPSDNAGGRVNIRPVDPAIDHIRGNPEAPITIVEFSDFECPFCARFHPTLTRLLQEFPDDVRWVYRHFPLSTIHPRATAAAEASECVAREAGNDAFWEFGDALFANQNNLGDDLYRELALQLGIDGSVFEACVNDGSIAELVREDFNEARDAGARGTPFSVAITPNGQFVPFSGALPYEQVAGLVEQILGAQQ